jgi:hypothetical protein
VFEVVDLGDVSDFDEKESTAPGGQVSKSKETETRTSLRGNDRVASRTVDVRKQEETFCHLRDMLAILYSEEHVGESGTCQAQGLHNRGATAGTSDDPPTIGRGRTGRATKGEPDCHKKNDSCVHLWGGKGVGVVERNMRSQ